MNIGSRPLLVLAAVCMWPGGVSAVTVNINIVEHPLCSYPVGALSANASGGAGPYAYLWSNGATTSSIYGLTAGLYSVTVTDANMEQAMAEFDLASVGYGEPPYYFYSQFDPQPHCAGSWPYHSFYRVNPSWSSGYWGPPPYYQDGEELGQESGGDPDVYFGVLPVAAGQEYTFVFSDANGCSGTVTSVGLPPIDWPAITILNVEGSCSSFPSGRITFAHGAEGHGRMVTYELTGLQGQGGDVLPGMVWYGNSAGTQVIEDLFPGTYRFRQRTGGLYNGECYDEHLIEVPGLSVDCGLVTGRAFMDHDLNCTRQGNEPYVPAGIVEIQPGPVYATTNDQGLYAVALPIGSYTVEQQSDLLIEHCTGGPIPFTISDGLTTTVNFPDTSAVPLDVQVTLSSGVARPGFELQYGINVRNLTPAASGAISVTFEFDPTLGYLSATPTPSSVSGNTITWNQAQLTAFQQRNYTVRFQVPPDIGLLGYELVATANVTTANTDGNPANNTATNLRTITGAYDPNDKLAYTSSGDTSVWQIGQDEWIDYTIRFQNTGTDTAFNVVITDTLPPNLDPGTLIVGAASHPFTWGLQGHGILKFYFPNILLPDSNVNEPLSHGFVGFRIRPHLPLLPGDEIENIANIFFDHNPPVITEPSVLTVMPPPAHVDVRVMLGGAYDPPSGLMRDDLRTQALLPYEEPYTALGYAHAGGSGGETVAPTVLAVTGDEAIVDWVVVELRDAAQPATVLHSRAALLRRDGRITGRNGQDPVAINAPEGNYFVAIRHRAHLGVMTATPIALSHAPTTLNLTDPGTAAWGTGARMNMNGTMVLWPGDVNFDGVVKYTGADNDRDQVLITVGGSVPTAIASGYHGGDANMDGVVKYTGADNDREFILQSIGGTIPTGVRTEQLP